jgi:general secretion pathway protein E/type IV pilus assembly protein PilB
MLGDLGDEARTLYRPVGCPACGGKGYRGRTPIMELLLMDEDLDEMVARRSTAKELRGAAMAKGFQPLAEAGMRRVVEGITTLAELARAVDLTGRHA